jgi:hypothetical protein
MGEDKLECEVFFNVNSAIGKGEFSTKDPDYKLRKLYINRKCASRCAGRERST